MVQVDIRRLLEKLSPYCRHVLESASGACVARGHYEVAVEHLLFVMVDDDAHDFRVILHHFGVDASRLRRNLHEALEKMGAGNPSRPVFSPLLIRWVRDAWLLASIESHAESLRSGALILALLADKTRLVQTDFGDLLVGIDQAELRRDFSAIVGGSREHDQAESSGTGFAPGPMGEGGALQRFAIDFTQRAREGLIDPVFARDDEIRQIIDILGRRRKNNPIAVGEPGVGKTAVVEGLALRIIAGDVPDFLSDVSLLGLDIGLLQAGAGVKGEFEARLKNVIEEVKSSTRSIILFIDEAHTLIGAGGPQGGGDAANLLKPALARGELRTIAATTWSEYKKYFEKDAALARRFQLVKLEEPSIEQAITILRGVRDAYERCHGVHVRDDALHAAARLSAQYLAGRQLPDKAVDVLDTACARVRLSLSGKPVEIDRRERRFAELVREQDSLARDVPDARQRTEFADRQADIRLEQQRLEEEIEIFRRRFEAERALVEQWQARRENDAVTIAGTSDTLREQLVQLQDGDGLISHEVDAHMVARVISDWTGVPLGSMVRDEASTIMALSQRLHVRIKGQDGAISVIDEGLRAAKAGLSSPSAPLGVFLLVGPSGTGKTETATVIADQMFGGERFMVTINMSEFQERHSVSRLIGSPPGYVGYGEGGVLSEGVRQRPYSVVLLDEVEKADPEVLNLFYQVFDKGELSDGEGRRIDFRNTVIFLTSNLASDRITELGISDTPPHLDELVDDIRPILSRHFKPALLARMRIVPYYPLRGEALAEITRLKLDRLVDQLYGSQRIVASYDAALIDQIVARCAEVETGARNIDHIFARKLTPAISAGLLSRMASNQETAGLHLALGDDGELVCQFSEHAETVVRVA